MVVICDSVVSVVIMCVVVSNSCLWLSYFIGSYPTHMRRGKVIGRNGAAITGIVSILVPLGIIAAVIATY